MNKNSQSYQVKQKTALLNWFIPLVLVLGAISMLLFYPTDKSSYTNTSDLTVSKEATTSIKKTANSLVSRFFNGSAEDKSQQIQALENTLTYLQQDKNSNAKSKNSTANIVLNALQNDNIQHAIQTLISSANQQVDSRLAAKTWINVGNIQNLSSAPQALLAYKKASGLDPQNSNAWNRRGHLHRQLKQFDEAEEAYQKVQQLTKESTVNQAVSLANFGLLNQAKGNTQAAEDAFLESLTIYTKIENSAGIASTSENLASLYQHKNDLEKAESYYFKALKIHQTESHSQKVVSTHAALGSLYQKQKKIEKAQQQYLHALKISIANNFPADIATFYSHLGILAQKNKQHAESKEYFEKSLTINQQIKHSIGTAEQYGNLAIFNRNKKNYVLAEDLHTKAIQIYTNHKHLHGAISQHVNLGFLYKIWNKKAKACEAWKTSFSLIQTATDSPNNRKERINKLIIDNCS